jgi:hypothetical protein
VNYEAFRREWRQQREYHHRIGVVTRLAEQHDPDMLTSRARQIARTWRSCLAYRLTIALGWRS